MSALRRLIATAGAVGMMIVVGLWAAATADAHVTVNSPGAVQGGYAVLTFRVPTESDTASTTALKVQLPGDHPLASVSVQPHPGWSFTATKTKLNPPIKTDDGEVSEAVNVIDWKADSAATAIKPGEFDQFLVSVGPLPDVDSVTFKAIQTYSDGTVVSWIEVPAPGSTAEPEHPVPTLQLAPAGASDPAGNQSSPDAGPAVAGSQTAERDTASSGAATTGIVLGAVGVLLGVAAVALTFLRPPNRASSE